MGICLSKKYTSNTELLYKKTDHNTPLYTLNHMNLLCKVVDIYDGDSCRIIFIIDNKAIKLNCRLLGIDTPEMKPSKLNITRTQEIHDSHLARNRLFGLVSNMLYDKVLHYKRKTINNMLIDNNKILYVKCSTYDKYGRLLVELFDNESSTISINQILVNENFAASYDGGTKSSRYSVN